MTVYGYLRVSTSKQEESNYKHAILEYANNNKLGNVVWIAETVSGRKQWKNRLLGLEFQKMVKGDIIITAEFSRIGRDFLNSISFIAECRNKGIKLYSISGDIPVNDDATSVLMLSITAWKAQIEREMIAQRTKIGLQAAKDRGIKLGRPKTMKLEKNLNNQRLIKEDIKKGCKLKKIAENYNVTPLTLRKFVIKYNLKE